jgi:hypothetical protein
LKVSIEERISRSIAFQIAGAEQRKERKPKSMLDGVGKDIAGRRSGESEQVGIGEEVKQCSEGSLKREL